jgi:hypothetical protein
MLPLSKGATRRAGQGKAPSCRRTPKNRIPHHDWPRIDRFFTYFLSRRVPAKNIARPFSFWAGGSLLFGKQPLENGEGFASIESVTQNRIFGLPRLQAYQGFDEGED